MKQKPEYDAWLAELLRGARAEHVTGQLVLHLKDGNLVSADWILRNVRRKVT
jgi:hypothetical protein